MKQKLIHTGTYKRANFTINTTLSVFLFEENALYFCYCAPLDLYGYGKTKEQAKQSFEISLAEFLRYTANKGTLTKELKRLGWKILRLKKKSPKYEAPNFMDLVNKNEDLNRIMTEIPLVQKYNQTVQLPAYA